MFEECLSPSVSLKCNLFHAPHYSAMSGLHIGSKIGELTGSMIGKEFGLIMGFSIGLFISIPIVIPIQIIDESLQYANITNCDVTETIANYFSGEYSISHDQGEL